MEKQTPAFGEAMKAQVEERLRFYDEGIAPSKNLDTMQARTSCRPHYNTSWHCRVPPADHITIHRGTVVCLLPGASRHTVARPCHSAAPSARRQ